MDRHILIIDKMPRSIELMSGFLKNGKNHRHHLLQCNSLKEGIQTLTQYKDVIDVVVLDCLPEVDHAFLRKVKIEKNLRIPVIVQTESNSNTQMQRGFELGVYYFLEKPFSAEFFNAIVSSAIDLYTRQREQYLELKSNRNLMKYVDKAIFKIKTLEDVDLISVSLAKMFPNPNKVVLGISEILTNAVEHGNLNITYEEKTELNIKSKWHEEVNKRLKLPENANKCVWISYIKKDNEIILNVKDEGSGFDVQPYLHFDPKRGMDNHGRGIAFANNLCFDKLEYLHNGNEVNCSVMLH